MFELINEFLKDQGVHGLFVSEFNVVVDLALDDNKVQAVKALMEYTTRMVNIPWKLAEREDYPAAITTWIKQNTRTLIPGVEAEKRLPLKDAKELVEFIMNNREYVRT